MNNIQFLNYTNNLIEKDIINNFNIDNNTTILLDYISNTCIYTNNKSLLKMTICNYIGTNIRYYFGFTDIILNNINKYNIHCLLSNVLIKYNDNYIWSDLIIKHYNKYLIDMYDKPGKIMEDFNF